MAGLTACTYFFVAFFTGLAAETPFRAKAGLTQGEVDWFIPHQANLRIIEAANQRRLAELAIGGLRIGRKILALERTQ